MTPYSTEELTRFMIDKQKWVLPQLDMNNKVERKLYDMYVIKTFMEINEIRAESDHSIEHHIPKEHRTLNKMNPNYTLFLGLLTSLIKKKTKDSYHQIIDNLHLIGIKTDVPIYCRDQIIDVRHCLTLSDILSYLWTYVSL